MTADETKRWKEIGIGAAIAGLAFFIAWKLLADGVLFGGPAGGPVEMFGESGTVGDAGGSLLIAVLTFLAFVGRHAIAWWAGRSKSVEYEDADMRRAAVATHSEVDPVEGTCAALIAHLRNGDFEAAESAYRSLAGLVATEPYPDAATPGPEPVETAIVLPESSSRRKAVKS